VPYRTVNVFDGSTFVISGGLGDLDTGIGHVHGFFSDDTRYVSHWRLTLNSAPLDVLSVAHIDYFAAQFFLVPLAGSIYEHASVSVIRRRLVRGTWVEEVVVLNHRAEPVEIELRMDVDTDFADLFEVKDRSVREREIHREGSGRELCLRYERGPFLRETQVKAPVGWSVGGRGFAIRTALGPHEERRMQFQVRPHAEQPGQHLPRRTPAGEFEATRTEMRDDVGLWLMDAPALEADWDALGDVYRRSLNDLAALRCYPEIVPGASLPAAGLPWFMALFGRDSLIATYQALPMQPDLARTTLLALAAEQADEFDDFRDAEPGKIPHELRFGELTACGERPHSPYYGTADATPLFLIVLDEYVRWTGDADLALALEPNARAALEWIDRHGDLDGDGYVEYKRRNVETGLENQCWKDSWNAMLFVDGRLAEGPIATCEIQGYVYDAKRRCARLAAEVWGDPELGERLDREAAELRERFHADFWVDGGDYYALALDGQKRQVDSLTSNIGHLLWSGIVERTEAQALARHLLGTRLFSGWGVRTMAEGDGGYNPVEYHNGTVWPHDNSLVANGLARYGYHAEAIAIATAQVEAAVHFAGRLPEVFAGYGRELTESPVEYPTASRPQAWASGAPLLLLRTLLGLEPGVAKDVERLLPKPIGRVVLRGLTSDGGYLRSSTASECSGDSPRAVPSSRPTPG
jgi:glycogen debranching enzyme